MVYISVLYDQVKVDVKTSKAVIVIPILVMHACINLATRFNTGILPCYHMYFVQ